MTNYLHLFPVLNVTPVTGVVKVIARAGVLADCYQEMG